MRITTVRQFHDKLTVCYNSGKNLDDFFDLSTRLYYYKLSAKIAGLNVADYDEEFCSLAASSLELYKNLLQRLGSERNRAYVEAIERFRSKVNKTIPSESDDFDGTTNVTYYRDLNTNHITAYEIVVKVRDSIDFHTILNREEAETIFGLYTYYGGNVTARNVANEFPKYTLPEVKKLFRAFKLTKDSIWAPPHLVEELSDKELSAYRMNLKERAAFKYADATQEREFKNTINKLASQINTLSNFKEQITQIVKDCNPNITATQFPAQEDYGSTLVLYMADMHIGARVDDKAIFKNHYDLDVVYKRIDQIVKHLTTYEPFKKLVVVNVGDALDGMNQQTARGGVLLPQNMNNYEQVDNYVKSMTYLFKLLVTNNIASSYSYISVPCGNHGGIAEYAATQLTAATLKLQYPELETLIEDKFYLRYEVDEHTLLICHGKDEQFMKSGFKINLDTDTELKINQYIDSLDNLKPNIDVISGDLHNESVNRGSRFTYYKVGSFFGSSEYCMYGWGNTQAHVNYHIINGDKLLNGVINLK